MFSEYQEKPQVIVGRRGAGKTAFLESTFFTNPEDLVVQVNKSTALGQIVLAVNGVPAGGRYPEAISELWDGIILTNVLQIASKKYDELKLTRDLSWENWGRCFNFS